MVFDVKTSLSGLLGLGLAICAAHSDPFIEDLKPAFERHCAACHGADGKVKGDVNLLALRSTRDLTGDPELMRTLIDVLDTAEMPPEDSPGPGLEPETRQRIVLRLRTMLNDTVRARAHVPSAPIRRMNRFQYGNAVRDLFQLTVAVFPLPERMLREYGQYFRPETGRMPETLKAGSRPLGKSQMIEPRLAGVAPFPRDPRAEHGFDNRGDHLSLSPLLMESFFALSRSIVESPNFNAKTCGIWPDLFAPVTVNSDSGSGSGSGLDLDRRFGMEEGRVLRDRLRGFLTRAFRRPVEEEVLERYVRHVSNRVQSGATWTDAMKEAASAVLASPRFLYLYDPAEGDSDAETVSKTVARDDYGLASRLSFFLWGSIPDDALLEAAAGGRLAEPEVLAAQVDRMLADGKLRRFCDSFPAQWLQLDRIVSSVPDEGAFPDFYYAPPNYRTSMDMMLEPLLLFETILVEDRSILELIDSDFSYRSTRLRKWYGDEVDGKLEGPGPMTFRRVSLSDRRQGGVLTSAAVMTMTSGPNETKPITRGAWVATVLFNDPPDPPPADVPPLESSAEDRRHLTLRERFAEHRRRADCAGCHAKLDPLGFALENFDPVGRWRDAYENGREVDPTGTLFRKHEFKDVVEFKDAILAEKDRFTRAFAAHLLAFALGREITAHDSPALDRIVEQTAASGYRMKALIHAVTGSAPFLGPGRDERPDGVHENGARHPD